MSSNRRLEAARERALADAASLVLARPDGKVRRLSAAIGDPQAPLDTFLRVLDTHGLLGAHSARDERAAQRKLLEVISKEIDRTT